MPYGAKKRKSTKRKKGDQSKNPSSVSSTQFQGDNERRKDDQEIDGKEENNEVIQVVNELKIDNESNEKGEKIEHDVSNGIENSPSRADSASVIDSVKEGDSSQCTLLEYLYQFAPEGYTLEDIQAAEYVFGFSEKSAASLSSAGENATSYDSVSVENTENCFEVTFKLPKKFVDAKRKAEGAMIQSHEKNTNAVLETKGCLYSESGGRLEVEQMVCVSSESGDKLEQKECISSERDATLKQKECVSPESSDKLEQKDCVSPASGDKFKQKECVSSERDDRIEQKECVSSKSDDKLELKECISSEKDDKLEEEKCILPERDDALEHKKSESSESDDRLEQKGRVLSEREDRLEQNKWVSSGSGDALEQKDRVSSESNDKLEEKGCISSEIDDRLERKECESSESDDRLTLSVPIDNGVEHEEDRVNQASPRPERATFWKSCCGLFELFGRSG